MKAILMTAAIALSLLTAACGNPTKTCEKQCDNYAECDGVPEGSADLCKDVCEATEKAVEKAGCEKEYKKLASCAGSDVDCDATEADDSCESESEDLAKCLAP